MGGKPLKRFFIWRHFHTQLKQGVNEMRLAKVESVFPAPAPGATQPPNGRPERGVQFLGRCDAIFTDPGVAVNRAGPGFGWPGPSRIGIRNAAANGRTPLPLDDCRPRPVRSPTVRMKH